MWFLVNSRHMLSTNNNTHENVMSMRNEQPTAQNEMWMEQIWNEGNLAPPVKASATSIIVILTRYKHRDFYTRLEVFNLKKQI